jgi:DNA-binding response OmpR family regulator
MRRTSSTILLVESGAWDNLRLMYAFAQAGHTAPIEATGDGFDAVAQLEGVGEYADRGLFPTPGLVIVGLDLERGSGFQVLEWIQSSSDLAGLPSVVLTSARLPRDVQRAYALGACDYRILPAAMADLVETVRQIEKLWVESGVAR